MIAWITVHWEYTVFNQTVGLSNLNGCISHLLSTGWSISFWL